MRGETGRTTRRWSLFVASISRSSETAHSTETITFAVFPTLLSHQEPRRKNATRAPVMH
jgi:hypothetical protein